MSWKTPKMFLMGLGCMLVLIGMVLIWGPAPPHFADIGAVRPPLPLAAPEMPNTQQDMKAVYTEIDRLKESASTWKQHATTMQRELTALRSQLTQVDKGQTALTQAIDQLRKHVFTARPEPLSVPERETTTAISRSPEEEMARADARLQTQIETLEMAVSGEKPDSAWARDAEQALHAMWREQEYPGLSLVHAECRTSLCRLELDLDRTRSSEESFPTLIHHMPWSGESFLVQITEGEAAQVVLYLAREGYALPQVTE